MTKVRLVENLYIFLLSTMEYNNRWGYLHQGIVGARITPFSSAVDPVRLIFLRSLYKDPKLKQVFTLLESNSHFIDHFHL